MDPIIYTGNVDDVMAAPAYTVTVPAGGRPIGIIELLSRIFHRK